MNKILGQRGGLKVGGRKNAIHEKGSTGLLAAYHERVAGGSGEQIQTS